MEFLSKNSKWNETVDAQSGISFLVALGREMPENGLLLLLSIRKVPNMRNKTHL